MLSQPWEKYTYSCTFCWKWLLRCLISCNQLLIYAISPMPFKRRIFKNPLLLLPFRVMPLSPSTVVERHFIWNIHNKSIANYHFNNVLWSVSMQSSGKAHMP